MTIPAVATTLGDQREPFALLREVRDQINREGFALDVEPQWLASHDLTDYELKQEAGEWSSVGISLQIIGVRAIEN